MISVLMPTRERPELAAEAIENLGKSVEILLCCDDNDPQLDHYERLRSKTVKLFLEHGQYGYSELYKYYNRLARESSGDWLLLWNDDAVVAPPDWAKVVERQDHTKPLVLNIYHEIDNLFPVISRTFYELLGHFSLNTHADSWVQQVGERSGSQLYIPGIKIMHQKPTDDTGHNSTHTAINHTGPQFSSEKTQDLINKDAQKVMEWYEAHNNLQSL